MGASENFPAGTSNILPSRCPVIPQLWQSPEGGIIPRHRQHRIRHRLKAGTADYNAGYVDAAEGETSWFVGVLVF